MEGFPERQQRGWGVPGVSLTGQLQQFPSHRALTAKINISFEIKSQPQEVFILEKEPVRQSVFWRRRHVCPHPILQAPCVWKSTGAKNAGVIDRVKGMGQKWKEVVPGDKSLDHCETWGIRLSHFPSLLSITMMGTSNVVGMKHKTYRQHLSQSPAPL